MRFTFLTAFLCLYVLITYVSVVSSIFGHGRRWFVGGDFKNVFTQDGGVVEANNIASWDGESWGAFQNGTNGPVYTVFVDACRTVYIGGNFTMVGGVVTGPVAKWRFGTYRWEPIYSRGRNPFSEGSWVNTLSVDCTNPYVDFDSCPCDVYIGGKFFISTSLYKPGNPSQGHNIAKWSFGDKAWDLFGSVGAPDRVRPEDEVYTIFKKDFGFTVAIRLLWVGGAFRGLKRFHLDERKWETMNEGFDPVGHIYSIFYNTVMIGTDEIYIGGNFQVHEKCRYVCKYDYREVEFYPAGNIETQPNGIVRSLQISDGELYAVGEFTYPSKYIASIRVNGIVSNLWNKIEFQDDSLQNALIEFEICGSRDAGCPSSGSVVFVGRNGFLKFYESLSQSFKLLGNSTDGQAFVVRSGYMFGLAPLSQSNTLIICLVLLMNILLSLML